MDLAGQASTVQPPNHVFNVGNVRMPQPDSAVEPGRAAVPVNPFMAGGEAVRALPVSDMAKAK